MIRTILTTGLMAGLTLSLSAAAAEGGNSVSLQVVGCAAKCPSFEIHVFDNGRMTFKSNNEYTAEKGIEHKNGMRSIYTRISKYLQDTGALTASADCTTGKSDPSVATVQAVNAGQTQKASWSSGCANQRDKGRSIVKVFVNQTGMWRLINSDTRWWEKYWEDPEMTGRSDVAQ